MMNRLTAGWQLILADLALILFLVTLAALASALERKPNASDAGAMALGQEGAQSVPVQALYRPAPGIMAFDAWLQDQPNDPRAQLTIHAIYSNENEEDTWMQVRSMARDAAQAGFPAKVIVRPGARDDIYARFAFDAPPKRNDAPTSQ